eukprot:11162078-Lingulodinium_polyedra.AAC.1
MLIKLGAGIRPLDGAKHPHQELLAKIVERLPHLLTHGLQTANTGRAICPNVRRGGAPDLMRSM